MRKIIETAFVLDIGSTSVRLLVGRRIGNGETEIVVNTGIVTHMQKNADVQNRIDLRAAERTFDAVDKLLSGSGVDSSAKGAVICTQSVRQAIDAEKFLTNLEQFIGIKPEVLSKVREGHLALKGSKELVADTDLLIDFGGGSTEIVSKGSDEKPVVQSVSIGAGSLLPIDRDCIIEGKMSFMSVIELAEQRWVSLLSDWDSIRKDRAVLVGGTGISLGSIYWGYKTFRSEMFHGKRFSLNELVDITRALSMMVDEEIGYLWGMETGRESIIFNGGCLLISLCRLLGIQSVILSEQGIRFGLLFELLHEAI